MQKQGNIDPQRTPDLDPRDGRQKTAQELDFQDLPGKVARRLEDRHKPATIDKQAAET